MIAVRFSYEQPDAFQPHENKNEKNNNRKYHAAALDQRRIDKVAGLYRQIRHRGGAKPSAQQNGFPRLEELIAESQRILLRVQPVYKPVGDLIKIGQKETG